MVTATGTGPAKSTPTKKAAAAKATPAKATVPAANQPKWSRVAPEVVVAAALNGEILPEDYKDLPLQARALLVTALFMQDRANLFDAKGLYMGTGGFRAVVARRLGITGSQAAAVLGVMRGWNAYRTTGNGPGTKTYFMGCKAAEDVLGRTNPGPVPAAPDDTVPPAAPKLAAPVSPESRQVTTVFDASDEEMPSTGIMAELLVGAVAEAVWRQCGNNGPLVDRVILALQSGRFGWNTL